MESEERDKYHAFAILDSSGQRLLRLASSERQETQQWIQVGPGHRAPPPGTVGQFENPRVGRVLPGLPCIDGSNQRQQGRPLGEHRVGASAGGRA